MRPLITCSVSKHRQFSDELRVYLFPLLQILGYSYGNAVGSTSGIRYMKEAKRIDGSSAEVRNELGRLLAGRRKQTESACGVPRSVKARS
jgi:hypothetical protein